MIRKLLSWTFIRFLLTGGLNTAFGYTMYALFTYVTGYPTLSIVLANITGVLFNFKTYGRFVFKSHDNSLIFRFFSSYVILTLLQIALLKALKYYGVENAYLAGIIITPPMAVVSYFALRKFVFRDHMPGSAEP